jgi:hypothetical protein
MWAVLFLFKFDLDQWQNFRMLNAALKRPPGFKEYARASHTQDRDYPPKPLAIDSTHSYK